MLSAILGYTVMILKCGKAGDLSVEIDKLHPRWVAHCIHKVTTAKCLDVHAAEQDADKAKVKADATLASLYDGSFRVKGDAGAATDPIEAIMVRLAMPAVKAAYKAANGNYKGFDDASEGLIDAWLIARPGTRAKAEAIHAIETEAANEAAASTEAAIEGVLSDPVVVSDPATVSDPAAVA